MEDLTKQQIILLTLLVSFVTSIATGIVTVSLMDQAPKSVTQTINRVVERTVEKVVPASGGANVGSVKETIVVKSDDLVVEVVDKNKANIIKIFKTKDLYGEAVERLGGLGVAVSKNLIATDIAILSKEHDEGGSIIPESYKAVTSAGLKFSIVPVGVDDSNNIVYFEPRNADGKLDKDINLIIPKFGDSDSLKLGQTVIAIGGSNDPIISTGIIASITPGKLPKLYKYSNVKTDIQFEEPLVGTMLLNLSGEIVGILSNKTLGKSTYFTSNLITSSVKKVEERGNDTTF